MPYTKNPHIPKVRAKAIELIRKQGWSTAQVARHLGVHRATIGRWLKKTPTGVGTVYEVPTQSSKPKNSPKAIDAVVVDRILDLRDTQRKKGPEVIYEILKREGIIVSYSTVYRTLKRHGRIEERSPWKKWHLSGERPKPESPGKLVQMDTIHIMQSKKNRMYIFTLIDVHSRWAYATASQKLSAHLALVTFRHAQKVSPFQIDCVQSDHGPEFAQHFTTYVQARGTRHRHSRVRQPNDNAHVERFNRTIQEEMFAEIRKYKNNMSWMNRSISEYLQYYNNERLHSGIDHKTPNEVIQLLQRS